MGFKFHLLLEFFWTTFSSSNFCWLNYNSFGTFQPKQHVSRCSSLWELTRKRSVENFPHRNVWESNFIWSWNFFGTTFSSSNFCWLNYNSFGTFQPKQHVSRCSNLWEPTRNREVTKSEKSPYSLHSLFARASRSLTLGSLREPSRSFRQKW